MDKPIPKKHFPVQEKPAKQYIPEKYQDAIFIGLLVISIFVFFGSAIFGGGFNADDNISSYAHINYLKEATNQSGSPLWIPTIFSGMPAFSAMLATGSRSYDIFSNVFMSIIGIFGKLFNNDVARVLIYYVLLSIGMYVLMRSKKHERFVAFLTAFAAPFSTYVITWIMIGHNTKPMVFCMFPFTIFFLEKLKEKNSLLYGTLLVFAMHSILEGGQQQFAFYGACVFGIYLVYEFLGRLILKQSPVKMLRPAAVLVLAFGLAFLMTADRYLSVLEYKPYSTRGSAPLVKSDKQHQDESGGHDYDYATMWSYSPKETFTFLVPGFYGNGTQNYQPTGSKSAEKRFIPTYWGEKESEDSPPYMGIIIFAFAIIGIVIYRKDVFVQFLFVLSIFALLLSFGKYFPLLYKLFFDYVPGFNNFRAPASAMAMINFAIPILAGYGLSGILRWRKEFTDGSKKILYAALGLSGAFLAAGLIFAGFKGSYTASVAASPKVQRLMQYFQDIPDFIYNMALTDWLINGFFLVATFILIFYFVKKRVPKGALLTVIIVFTLIDLWRVDWRRMEVGTYKVEKDYFKQYEYLYAPLQKEMQSGVFRIFDVNTNVPSYYLLQNINGYHSAKLRIYQDLLDVANGEGYEGNTSMLNNPFLWKIMNVKYIIVPDRKNESKSVVYPNQDFLPRAFFVSGAEVAEKMDILMHLKKGDFDPQKTAYIESALPVQLDTITPETSVKLEDYKYEYIKMSANATGNNLLFISEIYYPAGWKAYIDGTEVPIIKTNYAFRGIIVPTGSHTVEMKFRSESYQLGSKLSLWSNIGVIALFVLGLFF